ncbi:MAG: hypothetical protein AVDCRST_MAG30-3021, partial [uncultured Solirubrobacteraceae bacterium]
DGSDRGRLPRRAGQRLLAHPLRPGLRGHPGRRGGDRDPGHRRHRLDRRLLHRDDPLRDHRPHHAARLPPHRGPLRRRRAAARRPPGGVRAL